MITDFKELEMRKSGVIYQSTFEQIKKLYGVDPEKAGELAISAIELVLCGEISSDDMIIDLMLAPAKIVGERDKERYDVKVETARNKKIVDQKLDLIADLFKKGLKQKEIGERLGLTQQMISYRLGIIRTTYPDLLEDNSDPAAQTTDTNAPQGKDWRKEFSF